MNFTNFTINYPLKSDILFSLPIKINDIEQNSICHLYKNEKNIICDFENLDKNYIRHIIISEEPNMNIDYIKGKTIKFNSFRNKEINSFIAGQIENSTCDSDNINYTFYFRNCSSEINKIGLEFTLKMTIPNSIAQCKIIQNVIITSLYDVKCTIKGEKRCSDDYKTDFTVDSDNPEPYIISDTNILYYFNFSRQTSDNTRIQYYLVGGILTKESVEQSGNNILYKFNIENCSLNKPFNEDYQFYIDITLDIYDDYSNKNTKTTSECTIPKNIHDLNFTNTIKCSFTISDSLYYVKEGNYDITIDKGDQDITNDEEHYLYISNFDGLSTVTIYGCQIQKGQCDDKKKYSYSFSSCIIPKEFSISPEQKFILKTNRGEESSCYISNKDSNIDINCEINGYSLCWENNDVIIGIMKPI